MCGEFFQLKKLFEAMQSNLRDLSFLTTNGYLDEKMAKRLAEYKVSRVSVSIDSMDEKYIRN